MAGTPMKMLARSVSMASSTSSGRNFGRKRVVIPPAANPEQHDEPHDVGHRQGHDGRVAAQLGRPEGEASGLVDQGAMGQGHPLRFPRGSGGVEQRSHVAGIGGHGFLGNDPGIGQLVDRAHDQLGPAVGDHVVDLVGSHLGVDRNGHGPGVSDREAGEQQLVTVGERQDDPLTGADLKSHRTRPVAHLDRRLAERQIERGFVLSDQFGVGVDLGHVLHDVAQREIGLTEQPQPAHGAHGQTFSSGAHERSRTFSPSPGNRTVTSVLSPVPRMSITTPSPYFL